MNEMEFRGGLVVFLEEGWASPQRKGIREVNKTNYPSEIKESYKNVKISL